MRSSAVAWRDRIEASHLQYLQRSTVPGMEPVKIDLVEIERKIMDATVVEKTWEIPAHEDAAEINDAPGD